LKDVAYKNVNLTCHIVWWNRICQLWILVISGIYGMYTCAW